VNRETNTVQQTGSAGDLDHRRLDREYHDTIGSEYDSVILEPRSVASDCLFRDVLDRVEGREAMLDLGSGTGQAVLRFGASFREVDAVDHSTTMLDQARGNCRDQGLDNVRFHQSNVLEWLSGDRPHYDLISCIGFLHHLTEEQMATVLSRCSSLLSRGGGGC
jgi:ubiquinone/menaquinone biosynthesis C-methylase UbiE